MNRVVSLLVAVVLSGVVAPEVTAGNRAPELRGNSGTAVRMPQRLSSPKAITVATDSRLIVAVFDIQTKFVKVPTAKLKMLTEVMAEEIARGGVYQVMPPGDVKRALLDQSKESYKECFDEQCQIQLGRQLPANKLLTSNIKKIGARCRVTGSLYDLRKQTTDTTSTAKCKCNEVGYVEAIEKVAAKLRAWASGTASDVSIPTEEAGGKAASPTGDDRAYKRALGTAWRKLAKDVRRGSTEQKLEKYQEFLADYPDNNPHAVKVQKNIDVLEAKLERQETARLKAQEKKAAQAAKRERSNKLKAAYNGAKTKKGSASEQLAAWEKFLSEFPSDNPYLKTAKRKAKVLRKKAEREQAKKGKAQQGQGGLTALLNEADGTYALAVKHKNGKGVEKDLKKAAELFQKACDNGDMRGCNDLGACYRDGQGVAKDHKTATQLFRKVCDSGEMSGCASLARQYFSGKGVAKDYKMAVQLYRKGCDAGHMNSCALLSHRYERGEGVKKDQARAFKLLRKACDGGDMYACNNLAARYARGRDVAKDLKKSNELFRKACDGGFMSGCLNLAGNYLRGDGVPKDLSKANELYRKACDGGNMFGCNTLGNTYFTGKGVPRNLNKAKQLFRKACDYGHKQACLNLKEEF